MYTETPNKTMYIETPNKIMYIETPYITFFYYKKKKKLLLSLNKLYKPFKFFFIKNLVIWKVSLVM